MIMNLYCRKNISIYIKSQSYNKRKIYVNIFTLNYKYSFDLNQIHNFVLSRELFAFTNIGLYEAMNDLIQVHWSCLHIF